MRNSLFLLVSLFLASLAKAEVPNAELTGHQVVLLSKAYHQRALWFRDMPQFDIDSTRIYFERAVSLLENHRPVRYDLLSAIFVDMTDGNNRSYSYSTADSLAAKGLGYFNKVPQAERSLLVGYNLLNNSACIKVEEGELKKAMQQFSSALALIRDDPSPEIRARFLLDKGIFLNRYGLEGEKEAGLGYLKESLKLYESLHDSTNPDARIAVYKVLTVQKKNFPKSTTYYFAKLKDLIFISKNPFYHAWYFAVHGRHLLEEGKRDEARAELLSAESILKKYRLENIDTYSYVLGVMADLSMQENNYSGAIALYKKEREIAVANNFKRQSVAILASIAVAYEKNGALQEALNYQKRYAAEALDLHEERAEKSLRENELESDVLKTERKLNEKKDEQKLFIVLLVIGLIVSASFYRNYLLKKRANHKLEKLNAELGEKNELLDKRNAENQLLIKEIHHRVKNNLEMISSLLALQSAKISDPNVQEVMLASQNRVHSMGIIHQKLYQGEQLAAIEMRDYFVNLSESILSSFNTDRQITVECDMPELILDIDTAISIGLISNELLTNAFKYAFLEKQQGTVKIALTQPDPESLLLQISDDGIGKMPNAVARGTGFGTQLVELLSKQVGGTLRYENSHGTLVSLRFKKPRGN